MLACRIGSKGRFDGHAAQVHHRVDTLEQRAHRGAVFQPRRLQLLAGSGGAELGQSRHAQHVAARLQARPQHAAQAAGRAGEQQASKTQRGRVGRAHGACYSRVDTA